MLTESSLPVLASVACFVGYVGSLTTLFHLRESSVVEFWDEFIRNGALGRESGLSCGCISQDVMQTCAWRD
jgi:hypothetical protein